MSNAKESKNILDNFSDLLESGTNTDQLEKLCEKYQIQTELSINFFNFFLLSTYKYLNGVKEINCNVSMISNEDNDGIRFYQDKEYIKKSFKIKTKNRTHYLQVSIEKDGYSKTSLHDTEFFNSLIWAITPLQDYGDEVLFKEETPAIHYVYELEFGNKNELIILSLYSEE